MTDMFLEVAKLIQDTSTSSTRYGKIFALRDILSEINSLKDINTATALKIKILIIYLLIADVVTTGFPIWKAMTLL